MKDKSLKIFGDPGSFAIQYSPEPKKESSEYVFAYCHLILAERVIGNPDEFCFLNGWIYSLELEERKIKQNQGKLWHPQFDGLTHREIFEIIQKSNQLEEEFKYLPVIADYQLWQKHIFLLDETIDGYIITVIEEGRQLKFMWVSRGWYEPEEETGKLFITPGIDYEQFYETIHEFSNFLRESYPIHFKNS